MYCEFSLCYESSDVYSGGITSNVQGINVDRVDHL